MGYATKQNLIDRFDEKELVELTDRATPAAGAIDDQVLNRALADADARINAFLAPRYTLPIDPVPGVLEQTACDIARYYLYEDRVTDQVKRRYDDAMAFLKNVANGTAHNHEPDEFVTVEALETALDVALTLVECSASP